MKVIYFHQHFSTPKGGASVRSYKMARCLINCGHQVKMVCGSYEGGETGLVQPFKNGKRNGIVDEIDVLEFDLAYSNVDSFLRRSITFLSFAFRSISLVFTERYDVVFATSTPLTAGIPGIVARWIFRKPFVFEVRDLWPELPRAMGVISNPFILKIMSALEWTTYHSAQRLVGLSPGIVNGLKLRGVSPYRIKMVPNGCDLSIFSSKVKHWRPSQIRSSNLMAVFAGTHGIANGLDAVLDVAIELKNRKRKDINILLIGRGKLKKNLQDRVIVEGLDNVIFHDSVDKFKLAGLMASADVGLQVLANIPAFYYGTSPNKFFDYISSGLPVINNYPGWLSEIIKAHSCGIVVPPNNAFAFADALEYAKDNKEELHEMGRRGKALAKQKFNRNQLANDWVDWVTKVKL